MGRERKNYYEERKTTRERETERQLWRVRERERQLWEKREKDYEERKRKTTMGRE